MLGEAAGQLFPAVGVNLLPGLEVGELLAFRSDALGIHRHSFRVTSVTRAPATNGIEVFESESWRIDSDMARRARSIGTVLVQLIADGNRAANIGFDRRNARWRR